MFDDAAAMQAYYARDKERDRLAAGVGRVEFARTVEIVERTLPPTRAVVADVGGGPGRYTDWLVEAGHKVVHRDLVAHHVEQVRARHGVEVDAEVGDARALDLASGSVDVVLLLGPLYHLPRSEDRLLALREAARVLKPTGVVHVAAISRWAVRLDGILVQRFHETHPVLAEVVDEMERTGVMGPIAEAGFTGYAHTPDQLRAELEESGLVLRSVVPLEGVTFALGDIDERMDDPVQRALVLDTLRALESVPDLIGIGTHLLATATPAV